jgi:tRNA(fMet)-specific endonuclease VapC
MILLDTDALTFLERRESAIGQQLRDRLTRLSADHDICATVISYEEQTRGWLAVFSRARDSKALIEAYDRLLKHLMAFRKMDIVPYTVEAERIFCDLRRLKIRIGTRDLRIAAIALRHDAILLSRNLRDFLQVPNLRVEDWTKL